MIKYKVTIANLSTAICRKFTDSDLLYTLVYIVLSLTYNHIKGLVTGSTNQNLRLGPTDRDHLVPEGQHIY